MADPNKETKVSKTQDDENPVDKGLDPNRKAPTNNRGTMQDDEGSYPDFDHGSTGDEPQL